jgi:parallel beta-helix repeat protein
MVSPQCYICLNHQDCIDTNNTIDYSIFPTNHGLTRRTFALKVWLENQPQFFKHPVIQNASGGILLTRSESEQFIFGLDPRRIQLKSIFISKKLSFIFSWLLTMVLMAPSALIPTALSASAVVSSYSRTITVNSGQAPATLNEFPLLVSLTDTTLEDVGHSGHVANSNGSDIYFTSADGSTQYPYEIEKYDSATGNLIVWVKIPSIADGTILKICYGGEAGGTNTPSDVWTNAYQGVWHMNQANATDSTANVNNGTTQGSGTLTPEAGKIGVAVGFPGNSAPAYISCGNPASLQFSAAGAYTWEAWVNSPSSQSGGTGVIEKKTPGADASGQGYALNLGGNTPSVRFQSTSDSAKQLQSNGLANFGQWSLITATYNNSAVSIYINGSLDKSGTVATTDDLTNNFLIGRRSADSASGYFFGQIDEVKYSNTVRSADWIATEYRNQNSPGAFYTVGTETGGPSGETAPDVTSQPANVTVYAGENASFTAAASGNPTPTVVWQLSADGGTSWDDIALATNTTLNLTAVTLSQNGCQYRAVFTNSLDSATSEAAVLTVNPPPATPPVWPADAYLRAYNVGTAAQPEVRFEWSRPTDGTNGGEVWGYTVLADYVTPPDMHIDSVNTGDQGQYSNYLNRTYLWSINNALVHNPGYGGFNAWPEANKDYYFSMMARNWGDTLHAKSPVVHFNTAFSPLMYAFKADSPTSKTIMTYPLSTLQYVEASNSGKQTVYNVVNDPVDPQNAWFEIARTAGTNPGWTVAAGAVDPHWTLTDKASGAVIPLTPNLIGADNAPAANYWNSSMGTFYGYMNGSSGYKYWQVHLTYSGLAASTTTLESNHTYVLSLAGPWAGLYIPDSFTYSWEFTTAPADRVSPAWPAGAALTMSAVTPKTATLTWPPAVDNQAVTAYKVYRDGALLATLSGSLHSYLDNGLTAGSTHNWYVVAQDYLLNNSTQQAAGPVTTPLDTAAPTWPSGPTLMAQNIQASALDLVWAAALDAFPVTGYRVYQGDRLIATLAGNNLTYHVTGLEPHQSYIFTIQAGDESGNWSTSGPSITTGTIVDSQPPTWPNGATPSVTAVTPKTISISWPVAADNNKVDHYEVLVNSVLAQTVAAPAVVATLTGLTPTLEYQIQVVVVDPAGNRTAGTSISQILPHALEVDFTSDLSHGTAPLTVHFNDLSSNSPTTWSWDFDNNGVVDSTVQNPTFTYSGTGTYSVKLTAANGDGDNAIVKTNYITVSGAPVAAFKANFTSGAAALTVRFTDQSTINPTAWTWDFGDGGASTLQNPLHTYTSAGSYSVTLVAANTAGSDEVVRTDYIIVSTPPAPVAAFSANLTSGAAPLKVKFSDQSTNSPVAWSWDFDNDGTPDSNLRNPVYSYAAEGIYSVKLTVSNAGGSADEIKTDYINVTPALVPVAAFTNSATSGTAPLSIKFTDKSSNSPVAWAWDFNNDGLIDSTAQNPSYTYTSAGAYSVKLTVSNIAGESQKLKSNNINVHAPWLVDANGEHDFTTIQAAVEAATAGDTIIVMDGEYYENVVVNKSVTLRSQNPQGARVYYANPNSSIFTVNASNVVIDGFTICGDSGFVWSGISGGSYCTYTNNQISDVNTGISVRDYCSVTYNTIISNGYGAVGQFVMYDIGAGILLSNGSHGNIVSHNSCSSSNGISIGILVFTVSGCCIDGDARQPINSSYNTITYNTCDANRYGIFVQQSMYNTFYGNSLSNNQYGLYFRQNGDYTVTTGNVFYLNSVTGSTTANIGFYDANGNAGNTWNSPSEITYSYSGSNYSGYLGNYWGGYSGSDPDGNGAGEAAYLTQPYTGEHDAYPLMAASTNYVLGGSTSPIADFSASSVVGTLPLTVFFGNRSTGTSPMTWAWDFDNDTTIDSTLQNPTWTFTHAGNYNVRLTATNSEGSDEETKIAFIHVKAVGDSWAVGPSGSGADFTTIQAAIDKALAGETIIVWDGNYSESPAVNKAIILKAENGNRTVNVAGGINISSSGATVDGFTVFDDITVGSAHFSGYSGITVSNNNVIGGPISFYCSANNAITNNSSLGLYMYGETQWQAAGNTVSGNLFHDSTYGIQLWQTCGANTFTRNICLNNQYGIQIDNSPGNVFYLNSIIGSNVADVASIRFYESNSIADSECTFVSPTAQNYWLAGTQLSGLVGNYWSRYAGTDSNANGIGDTAYAGNTAYILNMTDNYPLLFPVASYNETSPDLEAAFRADVLSGIGNLTVRFFNLSSGFAPLAYSWDFGDGSAISNLANPTHYYATAGSYAVSLTVTNSDGSCNESKSDYIVVSPPLMPEAAFSADKTSGVAPLTVTFTDQSANTPTTWAWDFGDGGNSDAQNPEHIYANAGSYTVTLTATNATGSDAEIKTDWITVAGPPDADFEATATSGTAPFTVNFSDLSSHNPTTWAWDFDNDSLVDSTLQNPAYTYTSAGVYSVKLTAANTAGSDIEIKTAYITIAPTVGPLAAFSADFTHGNAPFTVNFSDQSSHTPTTWAWDFNNDGTIDSSVQNPSFTYTKAGTYTVKLIAGNTAGSDDEIKTGYIVVAAVTPVAAFTADVTSGIAPLTVNFTDQSTNNPTTWAWDFNNDNVVDSAVQNPSYVYTSAGSYSVKLLVSNTAGSDFILKTAYIVVSSVAAPVAAFSSDFVTGKAPLSVNFLDRTSTGTAPLSYAWDFNHDGVVDSTEQNPTHTYNTTGKYSVSFTVTNPVGHSTLVFTDYIDVRPAVGWSVKADGGADFTTIQAAVNAAANGETILVKDGVYAENVVINKPLTIQAEHRHGATVNPASGNIFTVSAPLVTIDGLVLTQAVNSTAYAIYVSSDYYCGSFKNNLISNVGSGIGIFYAATGARGYNTITGNNITLSNSGTYGIYLQKSSLNTISGNTIRDPAHRAGTYGIYLTRTSSFANTDVCNTNTISCNTVDGVAYGLYTYARCNYNLVYANSFIGNTVAVVGAGGVFVSTTDNTWTSKPTQLTYWYNGVQYSRVLGNYWGSSYSGVDGDSDGLGDSTYTVPGSTYTKNPQTDNHPLMLANPTAGFTSDVQSGNFPLTVNFSDRSFGTDTLTYAWDFGDNGTSDLPNPAHVYTTAGAFSVTLTLSNSAGVNTTLRAAYINVTTPTLSITPSAGEHGSISPSTVMTVGYGSSPIYTFTPDSGYHVASVTVDNQTVTAIDNTYTFSNVTTAHAISVTFAIDVFTITVTQGSHGTITPDSSVVEYGDNRTFTITPDTGYHIAGVQVDSLPAGTVSSYTFNSVQESHSISASFAINTYSLTVTSASHGTITPGSRTVNYGDSPTCTITPDTDYQISTVSVDGVSIGAVSSYTFAPVEANHTISATFGLTPIHITLLSPNGDENWPVGSNQTITWNSARVSGNVKVLISYNDGKTWTTIITNTPNDGSQSWKVAGTKTNQARIKVVSLASSIVFDVSDSNFNIVQSVTLLSPNGGENWTSGSTQNITWSSAGISGKVKIQVSLNGGSSWTNIVSSTANDGQYAWKVSGKATANAKIKVISVTTPTVSDASDAAFNIKDPTITVISPNGSESWTIGSSQNITWSSNGVTGTVKILLSRDGGKSWSTIISGTPNDGVQSWKVTGPATAKARIKVVSTTTATIVDVSDANFTIH